VHLSIDAPDSDRYLTALRHTARGTRRGVRITGVVLLCLGLALLLPPFLLFPHASFPVQLGYIILGVPSAVFGGALIVAPIRYSTSNLSTLVTQPCRYELTDEQMRQTSPMHSTELAWSAVDRIEEIPGQMLLWVGKRQFHSVPTTGLTEDQLAELRRFAADHNAHRAASVRPA
jgi:hypothetical protein